MRVVQCISREQVASDAAVAGAERIREALRQKGRATIVLAAGMSQAMMLEYLVHEDLDWRRVTAFHSDEYVGIRAGDPGSFRKFLQDRFFQWVHVKDFHAIAGERNPVAECRRLNRLMAATTIDVAFAGIGENGHIAFNDPPADFEAESPFLVVKLDRDCRRQQVKEGWFGTVGQVPLKAITLSVRQMLSAQSIICTVPDKRKAKAVRAALQGPVTPKVPASILQKHPGAVVYLDPESAAQLAPTVRPLIHQAPQISQCPPSLWTGLSRFHLFAAATDWRKIPERDLARFAGIAVDSGAATVTAWGAGAFAIELALEADSARRHVASSGKPAGRPTTSCFKPEQLDEALYSFLEDAKEAHPTCNAWVAVLVGDLSRQDYILQALGDPGAFIDRHIQGGSE
jgi:glucosamine-6-phosphate deaminase